MRRTLPTVLAATLILVTPLSADASRKEREQQQERIQTLDPQYQQWLQEVTFLITDEELRAFLALDKDYERDAFIDQFWRGRDPYPDTARNELKDRWYARLEQALVEWGSYQDARTKMLLLNGPPAGQAEVRCPTLLWPSEVWFYQGSERTGEEFFLLFYKRWGQGPFRLWQPADGVKDLFIHPSSLTSQNGLVRQIRDDCFDPDPLLAALSHMNRYGPLAYPLLLQRVSEPLENPNPEWVGSFGSYSTDLPEGAATFSAEVSFAFPAAHQSRTVVQGAIRVPVSEVEEADFGGARSRNLLLTGEVLQDGSLFDRFRYKFDFPATQVHGDSLPLVFERPLRPGPYRMILKLEDLNADRYFREVEELEVPDVEDRPPPMDPETAKILAEANSAISTDGPRLQIVPPHGDYQVGRVRFDVLASGAGIDHVVFDLDGHQLLTKNSPPYSVELDLGKLPRSQTLRVAAVDRTGQELASDELLINASAHRFEVKLLEPKRGQRYARSLRAEAEVTVPEGQAVDRVEFYLNESRVATLYQPPWQQPILLPEGNQIAYVRAVAYLPDGNSTEDLVFVNAPEGLEELEVQLVELYATVTDKHERPVEGLGREDFRVFEDGTEQRILRFEHVEDLPFHVLVLLDTSASMDESLPAAQEAALLFFQQAVSPKDRAALVTFNDRPNLAVKFTNQLTELGTGLAGLKAERGTSLYDSLVFSLYYFNGIKGQRALLVLSDGEDETSKFAFEDTLDFARRAGVTLFTIGLDLDKGEAKKKLTKLAEETGGRSFFVQDAGSLKEVYAAIEEELRSQYFLAYQSSNTSDDDRFRTVELEVDQPGLEAKTMRGYYP